MGSPGCQRKLHPRRGVWHSVSFQKLSFRREDVGGSNGGRSGGREGKREEARYRWGEEGRRCVCVCTAQGTPGFRIGLPTGLHQFLHALRAQRWIENRPRSLGTADHTC